VFLIFLRVTGEGLPGQRRLLYLVAWVVLLGAWTARARAQGNYEIQVYGSDTVAPKSLMLELHSNFTPEGSTKTDDGTYPTNHQLHETVEATLGLNGWSEVGFYLFTSCRIRGTGRWV
jgi:hypothetical protein